MACPAVVFSNVDANAWACLKEKATTYCQTHNFPLPPLNDTGDVAHLGFGATWAYDPAASTLTITCTGHPFFISCGFINGHVQTGIMGTGCIPAAQAASAPAS